MVRATYPLLIAFLGLAACGHPPTEVTRAPTPTEQPLSPEVIEMYSAMPDGDHEIPAVPHQYLSNDKKRQEVTYWSKEKPGTIIVDPYDFHLYYILGDNKAMRYTVSVGKAGYGFAGDAKIPYKKEWPRWTPTASMLKSDPKLYEPWRKGMDGGLENPLGARALYLYRNGKDTLYRIHGTPYPWTIGKSTTDGCIRLYDQDIVDLYSRVHSGAKVIVLTAEQTGQGTYPPGEQTPANIEDERVNAMAQSIDPTADDGSATDIGPQS